ncbi:hypothetical protein FJZ48_04350 [Candidatus Uhrbacteria bacterium]|nr:hypothetical protein [Candidatus Uhrbacteria bacterium]
MSNPPSKVSLIKNVYLYLVSFVALMMMTFATADLINTVLRSYVFTHADQDYFYPTYPCPTTRPDVPGAPVDNQESCTKEQEQMKKQSDMNRKSQRERSLIRDSSFIIVGLPLFIFHWRIVRRKED